MQEGSIPSALRGAGRYDATETGLATLSGSTPDWSIK